MRSLKTLGFALAIPGLALQAYDSACSFDYGYLPPFGSVESTGDIVVGADWLYFRPSADQLAFAEQTHLPTSSTGTVTEIAPNYKWNSGFRVNLGYILPCDQWEIDATWTYYKTSGVGGASVTNDATANDANDFITPILFSSLGANADGVYSTSGNWNWKLNQLDVDFSRTSFISRSIAIRPVAGVRFLWSQQNQNVAFNYLADEVTGSGNNQKFTNDFKSFGVKFGVDTSWDLGIWGLSLFGNVDVAVLLGRTTHTENFSISTLTGGDTTTIALNQGPGPKNASNRCSIKEMLTTSFGLQWATSFNCDESYLVVRAAWEHTYLPNFSWQVARDATQVTDEIFVTTPTTVQGDMGLYGLVLGLDLFF